MKPQNWIIVILLAIILMGFVQSQRPWVVTEIITQPPETQWVNNTVVVTETVPGPSQTVYITQPPTANPQPKQNVFLVEYQDPKYRYDFDFTWSVCISQHPARCEPWGGNGYPWTIIDYLESGFHTWLNDTGIIHNSMIVVYPGVGYDFCGWHVYRYWPEHFVAVYAEQPNHVLRFTSHPVSTEPNDYFQNGQRCPAAAYAQAYVNAVSCMEGDGEITKPVTEHYETDMENVTLWKVDVMDYCSYAIYRWPV